jgi:hypothetical protein
MTAAGDNRMDRALASWIHEGPTRAPAGLIEGVLTSTASAGQRPGAIARALGAPALDVPIGRRPLSLATWLAILLAAATLAAGVLVAGSLLFRDRSIAVVPGPGPSASPVPTVRSTPGPGPTLTYRNVALGFAVDSAAYGRTWSGVSGPEAGSGEPKRVRFRFGSSREITVDSGPVGSLIFLGIDKAFDPVYSGGQTAAALADRWMMLHAPSRAEDVEVSGWTGKLVSTTAQGLPFQAAFFVTDARVIAVQESAPSSDITFRGFLDGLELLDVPHFTYRSPTLGFAVDATTWTRDEVTVHPGAFGAGPGPGDSSSIAFWFGTCLDNICRSYVTVSAGDATTGAIVADGWNGNPEIRRVNGQTLAELERSWTAVFGGSTFQAMRVDGRDAVLARRLDGSAAAILVTGNGHVLAIIGHSTFASGGVVEVSPIQRFADGLHLLW